MQQNPYDSDIFSSSDAFQGLINFHANLDEKDNREVKEEVTPKKKLKPSERLLANIKLGNYNLEEMEDILKVKGNQSVISCAGSGKTTTLIFKIMYDLKSGWATKIMDVNGNSIRVPESIWVCTFLKSGPYELQSTYKKRVFQFRKNDASEMDLSDSIQFSTLHAEFKRALQQYGFNLPIIKSSTNTSYLRKVLNSYYIKNAKGNNLNSEDVANIESALSYTRNRLDDLRYKKDIYEELSISNDLVDAILRDWKSLRVSNKCVDFDDLQEIIYEECYKKNNSKLAEFIAKRYSFIYIDEFQDTSQLQYAVLKLYTRDAKQVFVIGDDDQTIYSWRGSDNGIITTKFIEDFSPVVSKLSVNYRCPFNILESIKPSIQLNTKRFEKSLRSSKDGGEIRVLEAKTYSKMVESLADQVVKDLSEGLSVAVLCRVNSDGLLPALLFDKLDKFTFSISRESMTLDSYIGTTVLSIVKLFTEKSTPAVKKALNLLAWDTSGIESLMTALKRNKMSIWNVDKSDIEYSCQSIAGIILRWRDVLKDKGEIETLKFVLSYYRTIVFQKDTQFNNVMRSTIMSVESLLKYSEYESAESFLYDLEDINERLNAKIKNTKAMVKIATVHEFKGKEADSVYVWNDSKDVFPIKDVEYGSDEYEEERRIHYIAVTRALQKCTLVFLSGSEGDFVREMSLNNAIDLTPSKVLSGSLKEELEREKEFNRFKEESNERYEESISEEDEKRSDITEFDRFWSSSSPFVPRVKRLDGTLI